MLIFLAIHIDAPLARPENVCKCAYRSEVDDVGPYCSTWIEGDLPFCYLSGGSDGRLCPGAVKHSSGDFYWTEDTTVCEKSVDYAEKYCNCVEVDGLADPYCSDWVTDDPPFCFLSGGSDGWFCPGATQWGNDSLFWTEDKDVCNRSKRQKRLVTFSDR